MFSSTSLDYPKFEAAIAATHIAPELPPLPTSSAIPAVVGLSIHKGWGCHLCNAGAITIESLRYHYWKTHDTTLPGSSPAVFLQRFTTAPGPSRCQARTMSDPGQGTEKEPTTTKQQRRTEAVSHANHEGTSKETNGTGKNLPATDGNRW